MWIVHAGWSCSEGAQYAVAGVFAKKGDARNAARDFAESLVSGDDDEIVANDLGVRVTLDDEDSDRDIQVLVEPIKLNEASAHIFGQIGNG